MEQELENHAEGFNACQKDTRMEEIEMPMPKAGSIEALVELLGIETARAREHFPDECDTARWATQEGILLSVREVEQLCKFIKMAIPHIPVKEAPAPKEPAKYYRCFKCGHMFHSEKWIPAWLPKQEAHWIAGKGTCKTKMTEITKEEYYAFKNQITE